MRPVCELADLCCEGWPQRRGKVVTETGRTTRRAPSMAFAVAWAALTRRMGSWSPCRTRTRLRRSRSFGPCHGAPACLLRALGSRGRCQPRVRSTPVRHPHRTGRRGVPVRDGGARCAGRSPRRARRRRRAPVPSQARPARRPRRRSFPGGRCRSRGAGHGQGAAPPASHVLGAFLAMGCESGFSGMRHRQQGGSTDSCRRE